MSLLLIAELQGQIKRRDERIAELEAKLDFGPMTDALFITQVREEFEAWGVLKKFCIARGSRGLYTSLGTNQLFSGFLGHAEFTRAQRRQEPAFWQYQAEVYVPDTMDFACAPPVQPASAVEPTPQPVAIETATALLDAIDAVLSNQEHAFSGGMCSYQKGSQTWQVYEDLRLAHIAAIAASRVEPTHNKQEGA